MIVPVGNTVTLFDAEAAPGAIVRNGGDVEIDIATALISRLIV